jgi:hypothetical protein
MNLRQPVVVDFRDLGDRIGVSYHSGIAFLYCGMMQPDLVVPSP